MDMEESSAAAHGDLADVVANATPSSTAIRPLHPSAAHMSRRYDPAAACAQIVYDDEHMSGGAGEAPLMFDAAPPVINPYQLHFNSSGYGGHLHHQQQLSAVQISSQHGCCSLDIDGDEATMMRRISPAAAAQHHHQMMKRKSEVRKVVCIPAPPTSGRAGEAVIPSDLWAWRKYGQKPIKGSPYPRGYYRCSSSKGCLARKQVERSRSDPNMLVITYTAEHNHPWPMQRNVLAGYARPQYSAAASSTKKHKTDVSSSNNNNTTTTHGEQPPELTAADELVFAELEELLDQEPHNSMVNNNNADKQLGVSYEWHF